MLELYHHGIKGQRWGVRRFQNEDGSWTPEGRLRYGKGEGSVKKQREEYKEFRKRKYSGTSTIDDFINSEGSTAISDFDNRFLQMGKTTVDKYYSVSDNPYTRKGGFQIHSNNLDENENRTLYRQTAYTMEKGKPMDLSDESSVKSMLMETNSNFGEQGTTQNCSKVAVCTALRKMGYTGIQAGTLNFPASANAVTTWFDNTRIESHPSPDMAEMVMKMEGPGSFGYFSIRNKDTGEGHAMGYSVLDGGKIRIEEGQNQTAWTGTIQEVMTKYNADPKSVRHANLTYAIPNLQEMARDSVVVPSGDRSNTSYAVRSGTAGQGGYNGNILSWDSYKKNIIGNPYGSTNNNNLDGVQYNPAGGATNQMIDGKYVFTTLNQTKR